MCVSVSVSECVCACVRDMCDIHAYTRYMLQNHRVQLERVTLPADLLPRSPAGCVPTESAGRGQLGRI